MSLLTLSPTQQKQAALLYTLKIAVLVAFFSALLTALVFSAILTLITGNPWPIPLPIVLGSCIGSTIGVTISTYQSYRNLLNPDYQSSSRVDCTEYMTLSLPYHLAFQLCLDSLYVFGNQHILIEDRAHERIEVALLPEPLWKNLLKSNSRISFRLGSSEEGITKVMITSKASLSTARIDFGQNERNVRRIRAFLQKNTSLAV